MRHLMSALALVFPLLASGEEGEAPTAVHELLGNPTGVCSVVLSPIPGHDYYLGERIPVTRTVTNSFTEDITIFDEPGSFQASAVSSPAGGQVATGMPVPAVDALHVGLANAVSLKPKQVASDTMFLDTFFTPKTPGVLTLDWVVNLQCQYPASHLFERFHLHGTIVLHLLPGPNPHLDQHLAALYQGYLDEPDYIKKEVWLKQLYAEKSPAVIPYLRKLLLADKILLIHESPLELLDSLREQPEARQLIADLFTSKTVNSPHLIAEELQYLLKHGDLLRAAPIHDLLVSVDENVLLGITRALAAYADRTSPEQFRVLANEHAIPVADIRALTQSANPSVARAATHILHIIDPQVPEIPEPPPPLQPLPPPATAPSDTDTHQGRPDPSAGKF